MDSGLVAEALAAAAASDSTGEASVLAVVADFSLDAAGLSAMEHFLAAARSSWVDRFIGGLITTIRITPIPMLIPRR